MSNEMGESKFLQAHSGQNQNLQRSPQDSGPYSAVSSFNIPTFCDSSLITPVSSAQSPAMATRATPILKSDRDIKLSPSTLSPTFQFVNSADDYSSDRYNNNPPMKYKHPPGTIHMSAADSSFPVSPYVCPEPFWGSYNVSATPLSGRSDSSPSGNPSPPQLHSAGGLSNSSSSYSQHPTPAQNGSGYRGQNQAPILIAPSPSTLRAGPTTNPSRQNSLQSLSTASGSTTVAQTPFSEPLGSLPPRGKKRKSPSRERDRGIVLAAAQTQEEEVLLDLSYVQRLPWKTVTQKYNERFPSAKETKDATLQMRKKRLIDRLRIWTDEDELALTRAVEEFDKHRWDTISNSMLKYGCVSKWPKELCQRKWQEMHPEDCPWLPQYDTSLRYRDSGNWGPDEGAFSEDRASACHSLHEEDFGVHVSTVSTATMEEVRSRAASDASSHVLHGRQPQRPQRQTLFDQQQHQHNGWGAKA